MADGIELDTSELDAFADRLATFDGDLQGQFEKICKEFPERSEQENAEAAMEKALTRLANR